MPSLNDQSGKITELRALLAEKYPGQPPKSGGAFSVALSRGVPELELPRGVITEVSGSTGSGRLFWEALLKSAERAGARVALVDGSGGFDGLGAFLWVLCKEAHTAIKATDLLLRDGNLSLVVLDLQMNAASELRRIPATTWYRFQRILEPSTSLLLVLTRKPMVSSAAVRLQLHNRWDLSAMRERRADLALEVEHSQRQGGRKIA
jgi:hypothetical protein